MPTLIRYLLLQLLKEFGMVLTVITLFMLFFAVMTELRPKDIGAAEIARMLPFMLPEAMRNAVQGATLYAVCAVFGRMASNNELVAVKSLGITPMVFVGPALCLATLASFGCIALYDLESSWGARGMRRVMLESLEAIAYSTLSTQRSYSTPHLAISVKRMDGQRLVRPTLLYHPPNSEQAVTITAEEAYLRTNLQDQTLTIQFHNGTVHAADEMRLIFPEQFEQVIPLARASRENSDQGEEPESMSFLSNQVDSLQRRIPRLKAEIQAALREEGESPTASQLRQDLEAELDKIACYKAAYYRRYANGFFCLAYAMIGIPVSILLRGGEAIKSFLVCFLPIVLVNQPLWSFSIKLVEAGKAPAMWLWLGNLILMGAGALALRKSNQH